LVVRELARNVAAWCCHQIIDDSFVTDSLVGAIGLRILAAIPILLWRLTGVYADYTEEETPIAEYRYNGLGQRIMWRYDANANETVASTERYYYMYDDRWRVMGVFRDEDAAPKESYVSHAAGNAGRGSSSYIDSVVMRDRDALGDATLEERRYYVQNWRADIVAITKSNGDPLQYVVYSPYGDPVTHAVADVDLDGDVDSNDQAAWANGAVNSTFAYAAQEDLNHDGTDSAADDALFDESYADNLGLSGRGRLSAGKLDNRKGYAGYEHDESLTMYHVRHRVYRADLGRWMTRDPLGYVDGMGLYEYVGGMAVRGRDPSGLARALPCAAGKCQPDHPEIPPSDIPIFDPTVLPLYPAPIPQEILVCAGVCGKPGDFGAQGACLNGVPIICACSNKPGSPYSPSYPVSDPEFRKSMRLCVDEYERRNFTMGVIYCPPGKTGSSEVYPYRDAGCAKGDNVNLLADCFQQRARCPWGDQACERQKCIEVGFQRCMAREWHRNCGGPWKPDAPMDPPGVVDLFLCGLLAETQCDSKLPF
jgi:RHS repeat-associated protein